MSSGKEEVLREGSYSEALRFFSKALQAVARVRDVDTLKLYGEVSVRNLLKTLLMLKGVSVPDMDLTFMGGLALDAEVIDSSIFSEIVKLNLSLNGFGELSLDNFNELIRKLIDKASSIDPYLSKQMELYRY